MTLWAIVPVKPLRRGKSRLAGILSPDERADLNSRLLSHTLETLSGIPEIEKILVVSRDQSALSIARDHGALTVQEDGAPKLNIALARATMVVKNFSTQGVLVIPADLPLLSREDIYALIEKAEDTPVVVIAPDHRKEGTNGLLISPAGLIDYEFGEDSFEKHKCRALRAGARLEICEMPSLGLDMDLPEDLQLVSERLSAFTTSVND